MKPEWTGRVRRTEAPSQSARDRCAVGYVRDRYVLTSHRPHIPLVQRIVIGLPQPLPGRLDPLP